MAEIAIFGQDRRGAVRTRSGAARNISPVWTLKDALYKVIVMSHSGLADPGPLAGWPPKLAVSVRACLIGYVYWLAFLLVLEPGNLFRSHGHDVGEEILRISMAAMLGCSISPLVLASVLRFPVEGMRAGRNSAIQLAGVLAISAVLIAASCVLADWFLASEQRPFLVALVGEFQVNWLLVAFCTATLVGFFHTRFAQSLCGISVPPPVALAQGETYLSTIAVKLRGETVQLALRDVLWVEAQGNYLALHTGAETHLVRDGLANIEPKLNPRDFVRVHRGSIVAVSRVAGISPLGSGDASLRLQNGAEVRLSRKYRAAFLNIWPGQRAS